MQEALDNAQTLQSSAQEAKSQGSDGQLQSKAGPEFQAHVHRVGEVPGLRACAAVLPCHKDDAAEQSTATDVA